MIESLLQIPKLVRANFEGNYLSNNNLLAIKHITTQFNSCISTIDYSDRDGKDIYISSLFIILSCMKNTSEKRSYQVKNMLTVSKIIIQILNQEVPVVMRAAVLVLFCRFTNLQKLILNGIYIISTVADVTALKSYKSLDTLIMSRCRLDSHFIIATVSSLHKEKLRELCLSENENINHQAVCTITDFINNNNVLSKLNLSGNAFSYNEAAVLAKRLVDCKNLQYLNLSDNKITDQAMPGLVTSFLQMSNLTALHFENNPIEKMMKTAFDIIIRMRKPQYSFVSASNDEVRAFLILLSSAASICLGFLFQF